MRENIILPACFGTYENGDKQCDGVPCSFKGRCGAFTRYLSKTRKRSTAFLFINDDGSKPKHGEKPFLRFCEQLLKDEANREIKSKKTLDPNRDKRKDGPSIEAKRRSRATKARRAKKKRNELLIIFETFKIKFESGLKDRTFAASDQIISTGQFYQFERLKTSDYIGIRCKTTKGVDLPLVVFKLKTSTMAFDVKLPFDIAELKNLMSAETFKKLGPVEKIEGRLKTMIKNSTREKLFLLCEVLINLVNDRRIDLPAI